MVIIIIIIFLQKPKIQQCKTWMPNETHQAQTSYTVAFDKKTSSSAMAERRREA